MSQSTTATTIPDDGTATAEVAEVIRKIDLMLKHRDIWGLAGGRPDRPVSFEQLDRIAGALDRLSKRASSSAKSFRGH